MGMSKDVNDLIKEISSVIKVLQKGYRKYGLNHKLARAKEGLQKRNSKANSKFNDFCIKTRDWIKQEMKK